MLMLICVHGFAELPWQALKKSVRLIEAFVPSVIASATLQCLVSSQALGPAELGGWLHTLGDASIACYRRLVTLLVTCVAAAAVGRVHDVLWMHDVLVLVRDLLRHSLAPTALNKKTWRRVVHLARDGLVPIADLMPVVPAVVSLLDPMFPLCVSMDWVPMLRWVVFTRFHGECPARLWTLGKLLQRMLVFGSDIGGLDVSLLIMKEPLEMELMACFAKGDMDRDDDFTEAVAAFATGVLTLFTRLKAPAPCLRLFFSFTKAAQKVLDNWSPFGARLLPIFMSGMTLWLQARQRHAVDCKLGRMAWCNVLEVVLGAWCLDMSSQEGFAALVECVGNTAHLFVGHRDYGASEDGALTDAYSNPFARNAKALFACLMNKKSPIMDADIAVLDNQVWWHCLSAGLRLKRKTALWKTQGACMRACVCVLCGPSVFIHRRVWAGAFCCCCRLGVGVCCAVKSTASAVLAVAEDAGPTSCSPAEVMAAEADVKPSTSRRCGV